MLSNECESSTRLIVPVTGMDEDDSPHEGLKTLIKRVTMSVDLRLILHEQLGPQEGMKNEATCSLSVPQLMS